VAGDPKFDQIHEFLIYLEKVPYSFLSTTTKWDTVGRPTCCPTFLDGKTTNAHPGRVVLIRYIDTMATTNFSTITT